MKQLHWLIKKAEHSSFYLWLLNIGSSRMVPFNRPHSFTITKVAPSFIEVELPYKKVNLNHIKGIHACAIATLSEYCTGIVLLTALNVSQYRIILKNINVTYHYQAKSTVKATFSLAPEWIEANIIDPLKRSESLFTELKIDVYDVDNNHISTGLINWQIKPWSKVRTK